MNCPKCGSDDTRYHPPASSAVGSAVCGACNHSWQPRLITLHKTVDPETGLTVKETNEAVLHHYSVGMLVEYAEPRSRSHGVRLYVWEQTRDCDGTPMYTLGPRRPEDNPKGYSVKFLKDTGAYGGMWTGVGQDNLRMVEPPHEAFGIFDKTGKLWDLYVSGQRAKSMVEAWKDRMDGGGYKVWTVLVSRVGDHLPGRSMPHGH
jgi:hypothetical protein